MRNIKNEPTYCIFDENKTVTATMGYRELDVKSSPFHKYPYSLQTVKTLHEAYTGLYEKKRHFA